MVLPFITHLEKVAYIKGEERRGWNGTFFVQCPTHAIGKSPESTPDLDIYEEFSVSTVHVP